MKKRELQGLGLIEQQEAVDKILKRRLYFEKLLSDISARFMSTPPDHVDEEIEHALEQIREFFDVCRCGLLELLSNGGFIRVTHAVYGEGVEEVSGEMNLAELFPWSYGQLRKGRHIIAPANKHVNF